jgi:hypothetical protein
MVNQIVEQMWDAAQLVLNPACLVDMFLDWIEEQCGLAVMPVVQGGGLVSSEVRTEALFDAINA